MTSIHRYARKIPCSPKNFSPQQRQYSPSPVLKPRVACLLRLFLFFMSCEFFSLCLCLCLCLHFWIEPNETQVKVVLFCCSSLSSHTQNLLTHSTFHSSFIHLSNYSLLAPTSSLGFGFNFKSTLSSAILQYNVQLLN